jgi:hypothetical protein
VFETGLYPLLITDPSAYVPETLGLTVDLLIEIELPLSRINE